MDKGARETVQWEVESILDYGLPDSPTVIKIVCEAVTARLNDTLRPLVDINELSERVMNKVLELLDYDAAMELLKEAHGDPTIGHTTQSNIRTFLKDHGIEVNEREE